jgi:hypothetical protein
LIALAKEIWQAGHRGEDLGLTEEETAFYDVLETTTAPSRRAGIKICGSLRKSL